MDLATVVGYGAAALVFLTFATRTMVPLRAIGIASNLAFIAYGWLQPALPILILHCILLPLNGYRLQQMLRLTRQVAAASRGDLNLDWLKPFAARRRLRAGELLYVKGEAADRMALVLGGSFLVRELGAELGPGEAVGELGLVAPDGARTRTVECVAAGDVLEITYDQVRQLCFQNPAFGFYFLELTARRLFDTVARCETALAASGQPVDLGGPRLQA
ncbi:MAG TPA: cyclic nucleotide-binding domain-containing protein [Amaricoccus sp.]|nr:cyclic nucleotide-binding domain-containing protein [Amaricoccus sp.]